MILRRRRLKYMFFFNIFGPHSIVILTENHQIYVFFGHHSSVILPWQRLKYMFFFYFFFFGQIQHSGIFFLHFFLVIKKTSIYDVTKVKSRYYDTQKMHFFWFFVKITLLWCPKILKKHVFNMSPRQNHTTMIPKKYR